MPWGAGPGVPKERPDLPYPTLLVDKLAWTSQYHQ
jgi:hypothetical protein